ncbi:hypothetical protein GGX14DRAFT_661517 [Mycena pura]|uniref:Protein kinase domain-containing protein n=1 Tax=Mycena pura TaxID=153505 RepID=A0AAD6Y6R6_9AGAR|nr:hypothetical protein GGX14DRAFT_661517 [Mycena pura]
MSLEAVPYEFRELHFNRRSESDVSVAYDEKMAARELALQAPLRTGLQFTLALESPLQNLGPNARKLPRVPTLSPTVLQLRDELQRGIGGFSQVWTAVCVDEPETCLVLKIIQPSICCGIPPDPMDEYYEPWDLAHNEAWVYQHLPHCQGLLIPYFFGLSTIVTPCEEEAWVLVLEFIPGLTVNGVADSASISNIRDFCALAVNAVGEFVRGGWILRDIRPPNFLLTGAPGAWAVVIIDLFLSEPLESTTDRELLASHQAQSFLSKFVFCVEDVDNDIYAWAKRNLPVWALPIHSDSEEEEQAVHLESHGLDIF